MTKTLLPLLVAAACAGCAAPAVLETASVHVRQCGEFEARNEWAQARAACERAAVEAQAGGGRERAIAALWYEYGRASGAICRYDDAQRGLERALKLDRAHDGPVYMSLLELARLALAQARYAQAARYYGQFETAMPQARGVRVDPIGYAEVLEEHAEALRNIGEAQDAASLASRAQALRKAHPGVKARTARTPYGRFCAPGLQSAP